MSRHHVNILHSERSPCPWSRHLTLTCETEVRALSSFPRNRESKRVFTRKTVVRAENKFFGVKSGGCSSAGRNPQSLWKHRTLRWTVRKPVSFPWTLHKGRHSCIVPTEYSSWFPFLKDCHQLQSSCSIQCPDSATSNPCSTFADSESDSSSGSITSRISHCLSTMQSVGLGQEGGLLKNVSEAASQFTGRPGRFTGFTSPLSRHLTRTVVPLQPEGGRCVSASLLQSEKVVERRQNYNKWENGNFVRVAKSLVSQPYRNWKEGRVEQRWSFFSIYINGTLCVFLLCFYRPLISYIRKFYYYDPQEEVYLSLKEAQLISKQKQEVEPST